MSGRYSGEKLYVRTSRELGEDRNFDVKVLITLQYRHEPRETF